MNNMLDRMVAEQEERFNALDKAEMINIARNYSPEERTELCKTIQTEILVKELERRTQTVNAIIGDVIFTLKNYEGLSDLPLEQKEQFIKEMRGALRCDG